MQLNYSLSGQVLFLPVSFYGFLSTGDTDASYKTTFIGANEASLNAEIADSVVYTAGAGLKFSHQKNADIEAGVVYAASENTNDVTFHVNGSYQF